jgi:hypothetical protein
MGSLAVLGRLDRGYWLGPRTIAVVRRYGNPRPSRRARKPGLADDKPHRSETWIGHGCFWYEKETDTQCRGHAPSCAHIGRTVKSFPGSGTRGPSQLYRDYLCASVPLECKPSISDMMVAARWAQVICLIVPMNRRS